MICDPDPEWIEWAKYDHERKRADALASQVAQLQAEKADYERSLALCKDHQPDVWEGDGMCVLCEAHQLYLRAEHAEASVFALREKLAALAEDWEHDGATAMCMDADGSEPCAGMKQCANELRAALRPAQEEKD